DHGPALTPRSLVNVRGRVETIKQAAETTTLNGHMRFRILHALDQAGASVEYWVLQDLTFPEIAARLAGGYRAARRALPASFADASPEHLHELRTRIVTHRYQM